MAEDPRREEPDVVPGDGRDETRNQRSDRNWAEILQELRATQTGTQILTGFLLTVAFQPAFAQLDVVLRTSYLVLVCLAGLATVLGLAPVILHRRLFRRGQKERLVRVGDRYLSTMLGVVSILVAGVVGFIFAVVLGRPAGLLALSVALVIVALAWLTVGRRGRRRA